MSPQTEDSGIHDIEHNPGHDFLNLLFHIKDPNPKEPNLEVPPVLIPTVALIAACCAIEAFVNMIGQKLDKEWSEFASGPVSIKDRIKRLYEKSGKRPNFGDGNITRSVEFF